MKKQTSQLLKQLCDGCYKSFELSSLRRCTKCRAYLYCGVECQTADWERAHKSVCKTMLKYDPVRVCETTIKAILHSKKKSRVLQRAFSSRNPAETYAVAVRIQNTREFEELTGEQHIFKVSFVDELHREDIKDVGPLLGEPYDKMTHVAVYVEVAVPQSTENQFATACFLIQRQGDGEKDGK